MIVPGYGPSKVGGNLGRNLGPKPWEENWAKWIKLKKNQNFGAVSKLKEKYNTYIHTLGSRTPPDEPSCPRWRCSAGTRANDPSHVTHVCHPRLRDSCTSTPTTVCTYVLMSLKPPPRCWRVYCGFEVTMMMMTTTTTHSQVHPYIRGPRLRYHARVFSSRSTSSQEFLRTDAAVATG